MGERERGTEINLGRERGERKLGERERDNVGGIEGGR